MYIYAHTLVCVFVQYHAVYEYGGFIGRCTYYNTKKIRTFGFQTAQRDGTLQVYFGSNGDIWCGSKLHAVRFHIGLPSRSPINDDHLIAVQS